MIMKARYILFAVAALTLAACSKTNEQPEPEGMQITIHAYQEGAHTKTTVQDGGTQVYWEPSDEIKVFFKGTGSRFVSQNSEAATVADFSGTLNVLVGANEGANSSNYLWGLYPFNYDATSDGESVSTTLSAEQVGRSGSFGKKTHISLACSNAYDLAFYNVTGGIRFSLSQEGIKSVTFQGNNKENLAGNIKLAFEGGVPAVKDVSNGQAMLTLVAPGGEAFKTGIWYYIEAIPCSLPDGFTMTFNKMGESATLISSNPVTIRRGAYGSMTNVDLGLEFTESEAPHTSIAEAVDLGLSVKWASWNVGASAPEEFGDYYAWGEVEPKEHYDQDNYKWWDDKLQYYTKYNWTSYYDIGGGVMAIVDGDHKEVLDPEDDAASVNWSGAWRMPTREDVAELRDNCSFEMTSINGVYGCLVKSNISGYSDKSFFIPAAGRFVGNEVQRLDSVEYWSAIGNTDLADVIIFNASVYTTNDFFPRYVGRPIRPVCPKE